MLQSLPPQFRQPSNQRDAVTTVAPFLLRIKAKVHTAADMALCDSTSYHSPLYSLCFSPYSSGLLDMVLPQDLCTARLLCLDAFPSQTCITGSPLYFL